MADFTETLHAVTFVTGNVSSPSNALGPADGVYTTDAGDVSWTATWRLGTPTYSVLSGTQTLNWTVRSDSGGSNPATYTLNLYDGATFVRALVTDTNAINGSSPTFTFEASEITNPADVRIELVTSASGGSLNSREAVQLDHITWTAVTILEATLEDEAADATADDTVLSETVTKRILEDVLEEASTEDLIEQENQRKTKFYDHVLDKAYAESNLTYPNKEYVEEPYTEPYYVIIVAGSPRVEITEDVNAESDVLSSVKTVTVDVIEDTLSSIELLLSKVRAVSDIESNATHTDSVITNTVYATVYVEDQPQVYAEYLSAKLIVADEFFADVNGDSTVLTDIQTGLAGDEVTEELDREDTILQQMATFRQDVEEVAAHQDEIVSTRLDAVEDVLELESTVAEVVIEQPYYRQALEELATLEAAVVATQADASTDLAVDANADGDPLILLAVAVADVDEEVMAEGYATEVKSDDIEEVIEAFAGVPIDPVREDEIAWAYAVDRVANKYVIDIESNTDVFDSFTSKLRMDIIVDVDALVELVSEARTNRQHAEESATADTLYTAWRATSQDAESEAYIGGAVINTVAATSATIIEDVSATAERLLARLLVTQHVDVDANGRDDVAGSVWFKSHSFVEEATASDALLTETIRRPTKDDVAADANADVTVQAAHLAALAAWSEDVLAESELLGNEANEAWVFNSRTLAFSRYVDFEASQVTTVDHEPAAVGARGLMQYAETFAAGYVKTGLSDYGSPQIKRMRHAYITAASRAPIQLTTLQGIGDTLSSTTYSVATLDSAVPYTHRIDLARGDRGQFWAFELRAPAGFRTTLLNLRVQPLLTSRRI